MQLFDEQIFDVQKLCSNFANKTLSTAKKQKEADKNALLFKSDTAFSLGDDDFNGVGSTILTSNDNICKLDSITLIGEDLPKIKGDCNYARIAIINIDDSNLIDSEKIYNAIRKIDYTKYHITPDGFMIRLSPISQKECVRVGKVAIKQGLDFAKIGKYFIDKYHENPIVKSVNMIFVTDKDFDYKKLQDINKNIEDITKTLDHLKNKVNMDCKACSLQLVCNEVEKQLEKDFKK